MATCSQGTRVHSLYVSNNSVYQKVKIKNRVVKEKSPILAESLLPQLNVVALVYHGWNAVAFPGPADVESLCQRGASIIACSLTHSCSLCFMSLIFSLCISISSKCTGIAAQINCNIGYLVINLCIFYEYFHLVGAQHSLSKWETQKLLSMWLLATLHLIL